MLRITDIKITRISGDVELMQGEMAPVLMAIVSKAIIPAVEKALNGS